MGERGDSKVATPQGRGCAAWGGCVSCARGGFFDNISRDGDFGGGAGDRLRLRGVHFGRAAEQAIPVVGGGEGGGGDASGGLGAGFADAGVARGAAGDRCGDLYAFASGSRGGV